MKPDPKALYHPLILQHSNQPFHYEKWAEAPVILEAYNPVCGDQFKIFGQVENGQFTDLRFHGYGCAVSKASSSLLVSLLHGKSMAEAEAICQHFFSVMKSGQLGDLSPEFAAFEALAAARHFPGRESCATLPWDSMKEYLSLP
ncbi:MAG: Fe-S cluster assembly sulfur transfer protein SufU [Bacteroidota bacterium]